ncbi:MAG: hypothetical protein PHH23_01565 [Paludibacteraceae bacterium]|nr:hypothetical protein [Paludibacteraceae bacterium]
MDINRIPQSIIKKVVEHRNFVKNLDNTMKLIEKLRAEICEKNNLLIKRGSYDVLFDNGLWEAKLLRQEYANILCGTCKLSERERAYIQRLGNGAFVKTYNQIK